MKACDAIQEIRGVMIASKLIEPTGGVQERARWKLVNDRIWEVLDSVVDEGDDPRGDCTLLKEVGEK